MTARRRPALPRRAARPRRRARPAVRARALNVDDPRVARALFDHALDGIALFDSEGRVVAVNTAAEALMRVVSPDDLRGRWIGEFVSPHDHARLADLLSRLPEEVSTDEDFTIVRSDGTQLVGRGYAIPVKDDAGTWCGFLGILRDVTTDRRTDRELRYASERLRALSQRLLTAQEEERQAIARELHDDIGQDLTAVMLGLQAASRDDRCGAAAAAALAQAIEAVAGVFAKVRSLSLDLHPPMLDDLGLAGALRWLLDRQGRAAGLHVSLRAASHRRTLPAVETACFRVAQAALTNVVRHARARRVVISLSQTQRAVHIYIRDDGCGFDAVQARAAAAAGASLGLTSMEERARLAGGAIRWTSRPGAGTVVHAWFPAEPPA